MRIDLEGRRHSLLVRLLLAIIEWRAGFRPGPMLMVAYRPAFFSSRFRGYMLRGMRGDRWSRPESELLGAFVSHLNACHF